MSGDVSSLILLSQMTLGSAWNEEFVAWKYWRNPAGRIFGRCAELDGHPVAFYGNTPVRLKLGDRVVTGAQAVDAMVAPEARRQGLWVKLAQETYRQMDKASVDLTYAFPNPISRLGFLDRLAWTDVGEIPRYVKLLDPAALSKADGRKGPKAWVYRMMLEAVRLTATRQPPHSVNEVQIRQVDTIDTRFDQLWKQTAQTLPLAVVRDVTYLTWRYLQSPLHRYVILSVERCENLMGYAILSLRDAETNGTAALAELMLTPGDEQAGLALLGKVTVRARELGCSQIQCWMLPHHAFHVHLLRQSGFVFLPSRFLPGMLGHTTAFIARPRPESEFHLDPTRLGNWFITMGDHDYY